MLPSDVQPNLYEQQFEKKVRKTRLLFNKFKIKTLKIFSSPAHSYRMRSEFRIRHINTRCHYCMFDTQTKKPITLDHFPAGSQRMQALMDPLIYAVNNDPILSEHLFQIEFLTTLTEDALITLIYHRKLDNIWRNAAKLLSQQLKTPIVGRCKNHISIIDRNYVQETLIVNQKKYYYHQIENSFTQPNAYVNQHMLAWAQTICDQLGEDLLELYCGNGNFTCVLSEKFNQVLATERSKVTISSTVKNCDDNQAHNVQIARLSSEEITQAINKTRAFYRLRNIRLEDYNFSTILVDPPRSGLDNKTLSLVQNFKYILYFSCNPETLIKNLDVLSQTYKIEHTALFDQFPYTRHIELGVFLVKI